MSQFSIALSADQDAALAVLISRANASRDPALPAITAADYVQARASEIASSYAAQLRAEDEAAVIDAYRTAAAAKRTSVKTTLGVA